MTPRKIILDCDPGVDDALALMLALAAPDAIELMGITTVAGNVPLEETTRNARGLLDLANRRGIPVHAGCHRPLMKAVGHRSAMHGADGLGGVVLDATSVPLASRHAVDFIIDTVLAHPGEVTLCPIGPLTNVALALLKEPRLAARLAAIVLMGGAAFEPGNSTPAAEFNVYVDPHAAEIVWSSGVPVTMFGLDVTRKVVATPERFARLARISGAVVPALVKMLTAYAQGDPCLHDPCVIAWLIDPALFTGRAAHVEVDCHPGPNYGRTVAATTARHLAGRTPNCTVMTDAEADGVFALMVERLSATFDGSSSDDPKQDRAK